MQALLVIDTLLVSPLGENSLGSLGLATTILAFLIGSQMAIANGCQLIMGRAFGQALRPQISQAITNSLVLNLMITLVFVVLLFTGKSALVNLLTDSQSIQAKTEQYLEIGLGILLVNSVTQSLIAVFNSKGDTKIPLKAYLLELPINVVVSYLLIFGGDVFIWLPFSGLGIQGAALGSLVAIIVRLLYLAFYFKQDAVISTNSFVTTFTQNNFQKHAVEVFPIATNFVLLSIGQTIYMLLFAQLSLFAYVAVTLIFPWLKMATLFIVAWAQATSIIISQSLGKGEQQEITPTIRISVRSGVVMSIVLGFVLVFFSQSVHLIYPNASTGTLVEIASIAPLFAILPVVRSYNTIAGNALRALGYSKQVLKVHFVSQWLVVLPLCYVFIFYLDLSLFWAFALLPIEEALKVGPFYLMLKNTNQNESTVPTQETN